MDILIYNTGCFEAAYMWHKGIICKPTQNLFTDAHKDVNSDETKTDLINLNQTINRISCICKKQTFARVFYKKFIKKQENEKKLYTKEVTIVKHKLHILIFSYNLMIAEILIQRCELLFIKRTNAEIQTLPCTDILQFLLACIVNTKNQNS